MKQSPAQRLKYASRVAGIANGWKKWQGETLGIERLHGVEQKMQQEASFRRWAADKPQYRNVLDSLEAAYATLTDVEVERVYFNEALLASDFMNRALALWRLTRQNSDAAAQKLLADSRQYFADFSIHSPIDQAIFTETLVYAWQHGYAPYIDKKYTNAQTLTTYLNTIYTKSILNQPQKLEKLLTLPTEKRASRLATLLKNDPALILFHTAYSQVYSPEKNQSFSAANARISHPCEPMCVA